MLHILGGIFFMVVLMTALTVVAGMLLGNREAIGRALGWRLPSLLPPLPVATPRPAAVRIVRRVQVPALRLAA